MDRIPFGLPRHLQGPGTLVLLGWCGIMGGALAAVIALGSRDLRLLLIGIALALLGALSLRRGIAKGFPAYAWWPGRERR